MRLGILIGLTSTSPRPISTALSRLAKQADKAGFATLVLADHFTLRPESTPWIRRDESALLPVVTDFYEAWSVLAFVAACTK